MVTQDDDDDTRENEGRRAVQDWESEGGAQTLEQHNLASESVVVDTDPLPRPVRPVEREGEQGD